MIQSLYPAFRKWSDGGSVWLVSDTHFDDEDREYMGYDICEESQIMLIKDFVHKPDTLIHLGDVGNPEYMKKLKCHKVLIMGNHDSSKEKMEQYFDEVYDGPLWISQKLVLSHEPLCLSGFGSFPCIAHNIHGHCHEPILHLDDYHTNIAANVVGFMPFNLMKFIKSGALKKVDSIHRITIDEATARKQKQYENQFQGLVEFLKNY